MATTYEFNVTITLPPALITLDSCSVMGTVTAKDPNGATIPATYRMAPGNKQILIDYPGDYTITVTGLCDCEPTAPVVTETDSGDIPGQDCDVPSFTSECPDSPLMTAIAEVNTNLQTINQSINDTSAAEQAILNAINATLGDIEVLIQSESDETQTILGNILSAIGDLIVDIEGNQTELIAKLDELLAELQAQGIQLGDIETALAEILAAIQALDSTDDDLRPVAPQWYCDALGNSAFGYFKTDEQAANPVFELINGDAGFDSAQIVPCIDCRIIAEERCYLGPDGKNYKMHVVESYDCDLNLLGVKATVIGATPCSDVPVNGEVTDLTGYTYLTCCPDDISTEPNPMTTVALAVNTSLNTSNPNLINFEFENNNSNTMEIDWGDGSTETWSGGTLSHTYSMPYVGNVTFTWDDCLPPDIGGMRFRYGWTFDVASLNNFPVSGGYLDLQGVGMSAVGDWGNYTNPVTGYFYDGSRNTQGYISNFSPTIDGLIFMRGYQDWETSAISDTTTTLAAFNNVSGYGDVADLPQNGVLTDVYTPVLTGENSGLFGDIADTPDTIKGTFYFGNSSVMTGLFENIPPEMGSQGSQVISNQQTYFRISNGPGGDIRGNYNNYDWSNWTHETSLFTVDGTAIPEGDLAQMFTAGPIVHDIYIHGAIGSEFANVYGNADNMPIANLNDMTRFHVLTEGDIQVTLGNGPQPDTAWYVYAPISKATGASISGTTAEIPPVTFEFWAEAIDVSISGPAEAITADPSYGFHMSVTDELNPVTGSFDGIAPNSYYTWRIFGPGNTATVDLSTRNTDARYFYFYKDGSTDTAATGGIATMSAPFPWTNIVTGRFAMVDQTSMSNVMESCILGNQNNRQLGFYGPNPPADTVRINLLKSRGWNIEHNGVLL